MTRGDPARSSLREDPRTVPRAQRRRGTNVGEAVTPLVIETRCRSRVPAGTCPRRAVTPRVGIKTPTARPTGSRIPVNTRNLLRRLSSGSLQNVKFTQFRRLVEAFGFKLKRVTGSHHIFSHPDIPEVVNIQEVSGETKPYQIRQFLRLVGRYNLQLEDER